jgi:hypothetical protein
MPIRSVCCLLRLLPLLLRFPAAVAADDEPARLTQHVILVTFDGLRWQELFGGADESLINKEFGGVKNDEQLRARFWRDTPRERREVLLPFFWSVIAKQGVVYGDPQQGPAARVLNEHRFSYPGYNEILTGFADPRIDSNSKSPNPNVTVLEWLHRRPGFNGRVRALASWDVFPFIINTERSGIPVNAGWQHFDQDEPGMAELNQLADELPHYWDNVRYDYFTFRGAEQAITQHEPRVLYVAFGETDDWAHAGRYDLYLDSAHRTDAYIGRLWALLQSLPEYAGRTSLIITTDHGRGDTRVGWQSHGTDIEGCEAIWIALLSPDVASHVPTEAEVTQSQVAGTVAALLGEDYCTEFPQAGRPLETARELMLQ